MKVFIDNLNRQTNDDYVVKWCLNVVVVVVVDVVVVVVVVGVVVVVQL